GERRAGVSVSARVQSYRRYEEVPGVLQGLSGLVGQAGWPVLIAIGLSSAYALDIQLKRRCSSGTGTTSARFGRTASSGRRRSRHSLTIRSPSTSRTLRG